MDKNHITGTCKGCGAEIVWLQSPKTGKNNVPVNPEGVEELDIFFNFKKHTSHFATCAKAVELRKSTKGTRGKAKNTDITGMVPSVAQVIKERNEVYDDFAKKLAKDKRGFIVSNKLPITMRRYALLNRAAELGLDYEFLISYTSNDLTDWICENDVGTDPLAPEGALPLGKGETVKGDLVDDLSPDKAGARCNSQSELQFG